MTTTERPRATPTPRTEEGGRRSARSPAWRVYAKALGPGLVTGASDDDPSGIATYSQAGASFGYGLLWTSLLTLPLTACVQEMCDRATLATGRSLGQLARDRLGGAARAALGMLVVALIAANGLNIAADLVAVGAGLSLLHAGPSTLWAPAVGAAISVLLLTGSFALVARIFKLLTLALLAYLAVLAAVSVDWWSVLGHTIVPHVTASKDYLSLLVAVLGTTISPYLYFWQSIHRLEEMREEPAGGAGAKPLTERTEAGAERKQRASRLDVFVGMTFSNAVMFAVIVATAATLGRDGGHRIGSAAEASSALRPVAGQLASVLFALGFVGSGMLAVPVLAGAGAAGLAGLLGKPAGFSRSLRRAPFFYALVLAGTLGGAALSLIGVNPIRLLVVVAVVNGVVAAPFLAVVVRLTSDRTVMGEYANGRLARSLGWLTTGLMGAAAVALFAFGGGGGLY